MMLLESQARSEDLYAWAVKRSSRCGLTAPLSCLALGDNPLPRPPAPCLSHRQMSILCLALGSFWRRDSSCQKMLGS